METHNVTAKSVFIAEDSAIIRERLVALLESVEGVTIAGQAETPAEAIEGILLGRPDVVVLDFQLLGGTGVDVLSAVRKEVPEMVVIMLTNHAIPQYRRICVKAGAQFFFDKSAEFDCVKSVIAALTAKHSQ